MRNPYPLAYLTVLLSAAPAHADLVTGWTERTGATPVSNMGTASPTVGNGGTDSADSRSIYASFGTLTLAIGQKITLSGSATLSGINTGGTFANQFRWGLYQENGIPADTLGWLGYFAGNGSLSTGGDLFERNNPDSNWYMTGTGASTIATATAPGTVLTNDTYSFELILERVTGGIQIDSSFIRGSDSQQFALIADVLDTSPQTYAFNRVGFLLGNDMNADQVQFSNIDVSVVPEPTASLAGLVCLAGLLRRRRA